MKKHIKLFSIVLCFALFFSCFTACGKPTDETGNTKVEQTTTNALATAPESEKEVIINGQKVTLPVISVKLQGKLVHLPCTVKEFREQSGCDFGVVNRLGEMVAPSGSDSIRGLIRDGWVEIRIANYTSEDQTIEDCMIAEIEYASENWKQDEIPVGFSLSRTTTFDDVQKALGSPGIQEDDFMAYIKQTELGVSGYAYNFYDGFIDSCTIVFGLAEDMV